MDNQKLVKVFGDKARTEGQVDRLIAAQEHSGSTKFFGGLVRPIGIELEVEGVGSDLELYFLKNRSPYWKMEPDGSLKDKGCELISAPLSGYNIDYALQEAEQVLNKVHVKTSIRTSIHIHADVSDFNVKELFSLAALYALFEKPFFSLQSYRRQNNPYCYEITDLLPEQISIHNNMKYCALNLAPVENQLTVEFRHGDFNTDMRQNRRWIQVVCKFMNYAGRHKDRIAEIVNNAIINDDYVKLFSAIMGKSTQLFDVNEVHEMMKSNALWAATLLEKV